MEVAADAHLQTRRPGLCVFGGGSGITRSRFRTSSSGVSVSREIAGRNPVRKGATVEAGSGFPWASVVFVSGVSRFFGSRLFPFGRPETPVRYPAERPTRTFAFASETFF